nr:hypothetical protein BaRGS_030033 [Batillaria attramentaria]
MVDPSHSFHIADYAVFGLTILISIGIGIYYALSGGRQRTTSEYLVGGRAMKFLPVAISLMVSFESSIMMLGMPAEAYVYGIQLCFDFDPRVRHTFWNLFFGSIIRGFGLAFNQSTVQRVSATKTQREARWVLLIVAPAFFLSLSLALYEGTVAYAFYETRGCDPLASKIITNPNQVSYI